MAALLKPQQLAFCHHIAEGMPRIKAFVAAGYTSKGKFADNTMSRLMRMPLVKAKIAELRAGIAKDLSITAGSLVAELEYARSQAAEAGNWAAYVKAVELKAKLMGLLVDKVEDVTQRRPALIPTKSVELTEAEWLRMVEQPLLPAPPTNGKSH